MLCGPMYDTCVHRGTVHLLGPENRTKPKPPVTIKPSILIRRQKSSRSVKSTTRTEQRSSLQVPQGRLVVEPETCLGVKGKGCGFGDDLTASCFVLRGQCGDVCVSPGIMWDVRGIGQVSATVVSLNRWFCMKELFLSGGP